MHTTYGADKNGLICGYLFSHAAAGRPVDLPEAAAWLRSETPKGPGDFVWLHFNLSDATAEASIRKQLEPVPEFFEALHAGSRSTRIEDAHDTLVAVVNDRSARTRCAPSTACATQSKTASRWPHP